MEDHIDEIELYFNTPRNIANCTEGWLQAEVKQEDPDIDHMWHIGPNNEMINLSRHCQDLIDQNIVNKISLNTYLDNMFK